MATTTEPHTNIMKHYSAKPSAQKLQKLLLNVLTLCLERNLLLFLMSVESSSGSVEGSHGK